MDLSADHVTTISYSRSLRVCESAANTKVKLTPSALASFLHHQLKKIKSRWFFLVIPRFLYWRKGEVLHHNYPSVRVPVYMWWGLVIVEALFTLGCINWKWGSSHWNFVKNHITIKGRSQSSMFVYTNATSTCMLVFCRPDKSVALNYWIRFFKQTLTNAGRWCFWKR